MPSIGELFVEIGTIGDSKELKQFVENTKEAVKQIDKQIQGNKRLLQYLKDLKEAQTQGEKAIVKENFANEIKKQKMLDQIDVTEKQISGHKELAANVGKVVKGIGLFVGAVTGAAIALNKFTNDLVQSNQAMLNLTRTTDIAQSTFQKWGSIGKMLGVENADQQLASLNQRLFDLKLTGEGARGFQLAGINPVGQDAEGVLEQLRARVSGMNDTMATYLLQQMGLDPQMLHLLRMSRTEFEELGETVRKYQLTPEQSKQIQQMNIQLQIAGIRLQYLKDRAIMAIMPYWTKFVESFARVNEGLQKAVNWLNEFISRTPGMQNALKSIAVAIGVIMVALFPLQSLLFGLYLLIDDIAAYFNGGRSGIGYLIKGLEDYKKELEKKLGELSFNKLIPQVMLDVGEVVIKAGKVTLQKLHKDALKSVFADNDIAHFFRENNHPGLADKTNALANNNPLAMLKLLYVLGWVTTQQLKSTAAKNGTLTGGAAPLMGYNGELPDLSPMFITPQMQRNVSDNSTVNNTDNRSIAMTNYIQTSQPVFDIQNQLLYARNAMNSTFA